MPFYYESPIIELCSNGMNLEGEGKPEEAAVIFRQAWSESSNEIEKCVSAHYLARHQKNVSDKLQWDMVALEQAKKVENQDTILGFYPSLYLNIAKGYEDLQDFDNAEINYQLALDSSNTMEDDGYGKMIKSGIISGIERVKEYK